MNEVSPVFDKLPKFFDGQETITTMNRARTWYERTQQAKEKHEKDKIQGKVNEEKSIQEILYGIKEDMGENVQNREDSQEEMER